MKKILVVLCLNTFSFCIYSQYSYYKAATLIKNDSAKLTGYVEKISDSRLSKEVKFKKTIDDENYQTVLIQDIKQLMFLDDSAIFEKVKYVHKKDSIDIVEFRLAKKLLDGFAKLYKLQLPEDEVKTIYLQNNTFIYILQIDTNNYVLDQKEKMDSKYATYYVLEKRYIGVLTYLLRDDEKLKNKVADLKFEDNQIIPFIDKLNEKHSEIKRKVLKNDEKVIINHGPTIGFINIDKSKGFELGYAVTYCKPEVSARLSADLAILYDIIGPIETVFKFPLTLTYHLNNNKFSPFIGLGMSLNLINGSLESGTYVSSRLSIGTILFKNYYFAYTAESFGNYYSLSIGYRFGTNNKSIKK